MENFALLGSLVARLHAEFSSMFYVLLPVYFALALAIDWIRSPQGSADFLETLKRAFVTTLLMVGFREISEAILMVTSGLADKISDLSGIDAIIQMAGEKARSYTLSGTSLLLGFNDLVIAVLSFLSYVVVYIARYVTIALYHFMWTFLSVMSPILILFNMFRGTSHITVNLFKSLIEVASYKIVWAVLAAMFSALAFGNAYAADGNYLTVIVLNFVIALAMLSTPLVVKSLVGGGLSSMAQTLGTGAAFAMAAAPVQAATAFKVGREILSGAKGFGNHLGDKFGQKFFGLPPQEVMKAANFSRHTGEDPQTATLPPPPPPKLPPGPSSY